MSEWSEANLKNQARRLEKDKHKNISNKELNKEIRKYLKSKTDKEWIIALLGEQHLYELNLIKDLKRENVELKKKLKEYEIANIANVILSKERDELKLVNNHHVKLIGRLEEQLQDIKYLSRKEVEKIIFSNFDEYGNLTSDSPDGMVTSICKLAIPEQKYLDKKKLIPTQTGFAEKVLEEISKKAREILHDNS